MPRVAITPQSLPADDGGLGSTLTHTTVNATDHHTVAYERRTALLFRNTNASTRTVTLKRLVRGLEVSKAITVPAQAGGADGILVLADLDVDHWLRSDDPGKLYFDVSAADFTVAAWRGRP